MLGRTTAERQTLLAAADIPNMPMNTPQDLLDDPHLNATGFIRHLDHPTEGVLRSPGNPTRWSRTACDEPSPAPRSGEHSVQIPQEPGYRPDHTAALLAARATTGPD